MIRRAITPVAIAAWCLITGAELVLLTEGAIYAARSSEPPNVCSVGSGEP